MEMIRKYKVVFMIVLPLLILVMVRSMGGNHFKSDAKKWAEPSFLRTNILTTDQLASLPGEILYIDLDNKDSLEIKSRGTKLYIPPSEILVKDNFRIINKHKGPVLIYSSEAAISARIWMVLSQMGIKDIYIFVNKNDNEAFKNKFRPDPLTLPELKEGL
jgi:hypothetical protein